MKYEQETEVILIGNNNITKHLPSTSMHIDGISLEQTYQITNLGVSVDNNLSISFLSDRSVKIPIFCEEKHCQHQKYFHH